MFYNSSHYPIEASRMKEANLHELALLFGICAIGAVGDISKPAPTIESDLFAHLARAALGMRSVYAHGTLQTAQAFLALGSYSLGRGGFGSESLAWTLMGYGFTIASSVRPPACKLSFTLLMSLFRLVSVSSIWLSSNFSANKMVPVDPDLDPSRWTTDPVAIQRRRKVSGFSISPYA